MNAMIVGLLFLILGTIVKAQGETVWAVLMFLFALASFGSYWVGLGSQSSRESDLVTREREIQLRERELAVRQRERELDKS